MLKGLSPLSDYHYRLMSESEAGARAYSSDFTFTTKPETPLVSSARAEKFSDTSILVSWKTNIPTNSAVIYTPVVAGKPDVKDQNPKVLQSLLKITESQFLCLNLLLFIIWKFLPPIISAIPRQRNLIRCLSPRTKPPHYFSSKKRIFHTFRFVQ